MKTKEEAPKPDDAKMEEAPELEEEEEEAFVEEAAEVEEEAETEEETEAEEEEESVEEASGAEEGESSSKDMVTDPEEAAFYEANPLGMWKEKGWFGLNGEHPLPLVPLHAISVGAQLLIPLFAQAVSCLRGREKAKRRRIREARWRCSWTMVLRAR